FPSEISEDIRQRESACSRSLITELETTSGCDVREQVLLCEIDLIEESVLKEIDFVQIVLTPEIGAAIADVSHLDDHVRRQLALNAERPRFNVTSLHVFRERVSRIGDVTEGRVDRFARERNTINRGARERRSRRYSVAKQVSEAKCEWRSGDVLGRRQCAARICIEQARKGTCTFANKCDREAS